MTHNLSKSAVAVLLGVSFFALPSSGFAQEETEKGPFTQGELARKLTESMDLGLSSTASANERFSALEQRGIKPGSGWEQNKPVTKADLEEILAEAGRIQTEKDPRAALRERGVFIPEKVSEKTLEDPKIRALMTVPAADMAGAAVPSPDPDIEITPMPKEIPPPVETQPPVSEVEEKPKEKEKDEDIEPPPDEKILPPPSGGGAG
ncbi:MAG: hypothetical protein HY589_02770 [Candidatus Omnitrophica bacterium]|nr:hypothetical protein [Candidatus Omnitrophota bacterium]